MSMNLYQLSEKYDHLINAAVSEDGEIEPNSLESIEETEIELITKRKNIGAYILNLDAEIEAVNEACKRMKERLGFIKRRKESLENYLLSNMDKYEITEISTPEFVIKVASNPESVIVDDDFMLDDEYIKVETKRVPNKTAIKAAIQSGKQVEGAHLERGKRLTFK